MNGTLTLDELAARRAEILDAVAERGEVWEVTLPNAPKGFVLGPERILGRVVGLYDEEYGWPARVEADAPVAEFVPGARRHPFIHRGDRLLAVSVSRGEYDDLVGTPREDGP